MTANITSKATLTIKAKERFHNPPIIIEIMEERKSRRIAK